MQIIQNLIDNNVSIDGSRNCINWFNLTLQSAECKDSTVTHIFVNLDLLNESEKWNNIVPNNFLTVAHMQNITIIINNITPIRNYFLDKCSLVNN